MNLLKVVFKVIFGIPIILYGFKMFVMPFKNKYVWDFRRVIRIKYGDALNEIKIKRMMEINKVMIWLVASFLICLGVYILI